MKLAWNNLNKKAIWSKFIFAKYFKEDVFVRSTPQVSSVRPGLLKDMWVGNASLASQSGLPLSAFKNSKARVSHFISCNPQAWYFPMVSRNSYWNALVWYKGIHPRVSLMSWKIVNNAIVINKKIRSIGIPLVSNCTLCGNSMKTRDHLFVTCCFANSMWAGFPISFSNKWKTLGCHGRTKDLWIIGWSHIITTIWISRNKCPFDEGRPMSQLQWSKKWIMEYISSITSNWREFKTKNDPFFLEVIWLLPMPGCAKLNIDGCSKGNPGRTYSYRNKLSAELNAFIYGVKYVIRKGFTNVWIECDFFGIILATRSSLVLWCIQIRWKNAIASLNKISCKISHVYREANATVDKMANIGCHMYAYQEWDTYPNSVGYHTS
ncbi:hypothetical protein AMTRI_Chr13g84980 [Amborella trichopoda]